MKEIRDKENFNFPCLVEFDVSNSSLVHTACLIRDDSFAYIINLDSSLDYYKRPIHFITFLLDYAKPKGGLHKLTP